LDDRCGISSKKEEIHLEERLFGKIARIGKRRGGYGGDDE
jgi:hypothetical protein